MFVGPFVSNKYVKFHDSGLKRSREIPPEAVGDCILDRFLKYNFRPEGDNDVISSVAVENVSVDVCVKFGDSRSNGFQDIRGADFATGRSLSQ